MTKRMRLGLVVSSMCLLSTTSSYAYPVTSWPAQCSGPIGMYEARVYTATDRGGICYSLPLDTAADSWATWDASTGFPNDDIESVETGSGVYLVLLWHTFNTKDNGATLNTPQLSYTPNLGSWRNAASAARVQTFAPEICWVSGRVNFYTDANYGGDCTALSPGTYPGPVQMGFRNDTLTSVNNLATSASACLNENVGNGYPLALIGPQNSNPNLGSILWNDRTSATLISNQCLR